MGVMPSQITCLTIVYSTVNSGADQRKHQSSASLAFVRGIHRWPANSPHKWPVTRKMLPFDDVIVILRLLKVCFNCFGNHSLINSLKKWKEGPVINRLGKTKILHVAWISNYIHNNAWDEITYPFLNFNGAIVEDYEWISNYQACNYLSMLGLKLNRVSKSGYSGLPIHRNSFS